MIPQSGNASMSLCRHIVRLPLSVLRTILDLALCATVQLLVISMLAVLLLLAGLFWLITAPLVFLVQVLPADEKKK
jgi:hypothetical protein